MAPGHLRALDHAQRISVERQRATCGDARVELAQAAGGGVARVDERLDFPVRGARLLVVGLEAGTRHVDLAAHLQRARPTLAAQLQGDRADGAQVGGDVLAGFAVPARGALHEHAAFVAQADRQAVELRLHREHRVGDVQALFDPALEYLGLVVTTLLVFPLGRWAFSRAERTMRVRGTLGQY